MKPLKSWLFFLSFFIDFFPPQVALCTCSNISSSFSPLGHFRCPPPQISFRHQMKMTTDYTFVCADTYKCAMDACAYVLYVHMHQCQGNCMCNSDYNLMIQAGDKGNCFLDTYPSCFISQCSISTQHRISLLLNSSFISFGWQIWHTVCCLNNFKSELDSCVTLSRGCSVFQSVLFWLLSHRIVS